MIATFKILKTNLLAKALFLKIVEQFKGHQRFQN